MDAIQLKISLRQLQYFVAAARHGNLKTAAASLNASAASLSLAVAHIEEITGRQLFHRRHARGLVLTDEGKELAMESRNILQQVYDLQNLGVVNPHQIAAKIDFGCLHSLAPFVGPAFIKAFANSYPSVAVRIFEDHGEGLRHGLRSGMYDLIIGYDTDMPSAFNIVPIKALPPLILLSADHPLAREDTIALRQLVDEPFIYVSYPHSRDYLVSVFSECGVPQPEIYQMVQSYELLRNLVGQGLGYAVATICPPFGHDPSKEVVARPIAETPRTPVLVVANLRGARMNKVLTAFVETFRDVVETLELVH